VACPGIHPSLTFHPGLLGSGCQRYGCPVIQRSGDAHLPAELLAADWSTEQRSLLRSPQCRLLAMAAGRRLPLVWSRGLAGLVLACNCPRGLSPVAVLPMWASIRRWRRGLPVREMAGQPGRESQAGDIPGIGRGAEAIAALTTAVQYWCCMRASRASGLNVNLSDRLGQRKRARAAARSGDEARRRAGGRSTPPPPAALLAKNLVRRRWPATASTGSGGVERARLDRKPSVCKLRATPGSAGGSPAPSVLRAAVPGE